MAPVSATQIEFAFDVVNEKPGWFPIHVSGNRNSAVVNLFQLSPLE
jgi:hypothetical protein